ncbi:MAG: ATP-binding protein [Candidatus Kapabacteria bacterium]|nr:ATP-binding protein [Candidatus Kapabacteria bacterium]
MISAHLSLPDTFDKLLTDSGHEALLLHAPNGAIHFASPSAKDVLSSDSLQGKNLIELIHEDDAAVVIDGFRDAVIRGVPFLPHTVRIGSRHIVVMTMPVKDRTGGVIELQTTLRDVTEFVVLRDQIQVQEAVSVATSVLAKVGGWRLDVASNELYWSDEVRRIHEVPEDFVPSVETAIGFYSKQHRHIIEKAVTDAIESAVAVDIESPLITYTGKHIWVRASVTPEVVDGVVVRIYGAFQDITELHQREEQLRSTVAELTRQRDQLEEYTYVISHHLRGPVGNIVSLLNLLSEDDDGKQAPDTVRHLRDSARALLDTLEDLTHAIAVRQEEVPNVVDLRITDVIDSAASSLSEMITASGTKISVNVSEVPTLSYPQEYLETIFRQLFSNAIRFAAPGRPPRVRIKSMEIEGVVAIEFSDNGLGIDLDKYGDKIFRIRTSFHRGTTGRGVGLFLIKTIVESMGGTISVNSVIDKGTTFRIMFALSSSKASV